MKDFKQLIIYAVVSFVGIILLIKMSQSDVISPNFLVFTAIFLVVVLPIIVAVKIGKKERENR